MRRPTTVELMLLATILLWALNLSVTKVHPRRTGSSRSRTRPFATALAGAIFVVLTLVAERSLRIERRHVGVLAFAAVTLWLNQLSLRLRARRDDGVDDRPAARGDSDLRGALRARARKGAADGQVLARRGDLVRGCRARRARLGRGRLRWVRGVLLGLATSATWAAYSVAITPLMQTYSPSRVSAVVIPLAWVLIALVGLPTTREQDWSIGWEIWLLLVFATLGPLVLTNVLWFRSLHRIGPARATLAANLQPFVAALLAVVLLSEPLGLLQVLGGILIAAGIFVARQARARAAGDSSPRIRPMSEHDFMPIDGWDHLEIWVGNAKQSAYFYENAYGFTRTAYAGPETGVRDRASYVLEQGDIRFVLTSGLRADSEICKWAATKGDSVRDVALAVPDAIERVSAGRAARRARRGRAALGRGRHGPRRARRDRDLRRQRPHVRQSLRVRGRVPARLSVRLAERRPARGVGLISIDHVVGNVELGRMDEWVEFYARVLGFTQLTHFSDEDISTEYSALMSKVMTDGEGKIKFPINEPAEGKRKSQIEEYLEFHGGPGVQHVAMQSEDIVKTVAALREHGVLFIATPDTYYDIVQERVGEIEQSWDDLRSMGILADRDEEGYLLQLFTKIVQDRPTLFFEVIERHGSRGFGIGNFKSLFEAIEREQALRGNL